MPGVGAAVGSITRFMFKMRSTMLHFPGVPPWHVWPFGHSSLKKGDEVWVWPVRQN